MSEYSRDTIQKTIQRLREAEDSHTFGEEVKKLRESLKQMGMPVEVLLELEERAYYLENHYSDRDTKEKMRQARERVVSYVDAVVGKDAAGTPFLANVLENFYLFLEALLEREPHKKAGIRKTDLEKIKIHNEYDVQHLLYAYLKPLYPEARAEVVEDTGYHSVRVDIAVNADCVIEVKCTRQGLSAGKLLEEIEADMVHYHAKEIYFFIYDKEKRIDNPPAFRRSNENRVQGKRIHIIIHQPKIL